MNDEQPLTLRFPDPMKLAAQRAREFQKISSLERWSEIIALVNFGLKMARLSPRREFIEQRWLAQEKEMQEIQRKLFAQHGL